MRINNLIKFSFLFIVISVSLMSCKENLDEIYFDSSKTSTSNSSVYLGSVRIAFSGVGQTKNFSNTYYSNNETKSWYVLKSDISGAAYISFYDSNFATDYGDELRFYDGKNGTLLASHSGYTSLNKYIWLNQITSDRLYIEFTSDSQYTDYGFSVTCTAEY